MQKSKERGAHLPGARKSDAARDIDRILAVLTENDAFISETDAPGLPRLGVFALRRGVTMRIASLSAEAMDCLIRADLAAWSGEGRDRRARLTETGRARARRAAADARAEPSFLAQHHDLERRAVENDAPSALVNEGESPLVWLARRKDAHGRPLLDPTCVEAGERLRRDLTTAQMLPRVTANWSAAVASGARGQTPMHMSDLVVAARQRASRALEAVGADFAGLLIDVCGFLKGMERVERERGWPPRSGRIVLGLALARLAAHYGLSMEAKGPNRSAGIVGWGAADYRPALSPTETP